MSSTDSKRDDDETLDIAQAAKYCHLGYEAMKELLDSGEVPAWSQNQKHTVVHIDDLRDYVRARARKQAEERRKARDQAAAPPPPPEPRRPRRRGRASPLPDLAVYEVTTGGRQGPRPAGSRNA